MASALIRFSLRVIELAFYLHTIIHEYTNFKGSSEILRLGFVSEVVSIRTSEVDFDRGLIKTWHEKKDRGRLVTPTLEAVSAIRKYLNSVPKQLQYLFSMSNKTIERIIQKYSQHVLGFVVSWPSLRSTYVSRSVESEQSPAVVMLNTGDSPLQF